MISLMLFRADKIAVLFQKMTLIVPVSKTLQFKMNMESCIMESNSNLLCELWEIL